MTNDDCIALVVRAPVARDRRTSHAQVTATERREEAHACIHPA